MEQLEQPDAIFEAELKQALKESKREAHSWQTVERKRKHSQRILLLSDLEDIEEEKELQTALRRQQQMRQSAPLRCRRAPRVKRLRRSRGASSGVRGAACRQSCRR